MRKPEASPKVRTPVKLAVLSLLFAAAVPAVVRRAPTAAPPTVPAVQTCPTPPTVSPQIPTDVCIPAGFSGNPIAFFDDYSWRTFIAVVWPALNGQRGMPDTSKTVGTMGVPRVFETYKATWEVFHNDGSAPDPWESYGAPSVNPCNQSLGFGDLALASFSKFSDLGQAGIGSLVGPLMAQNNTWARFQTGLNEVEFDQITANNWYLRANLPPAGQSLHFNDGALDVKSAWMDMTGVAHPERYYTRQVFLMDPNTGTCSPKTVGLVGLHIVQKTPSRPQWIWSTFEQIDNVPPVQSGSPGSNLNNGNAAMKMPATNPFTLDPLPSPMPTPFNVTRVKPINSSTQGTNAVYQKALAGTPWQFYQLVMTQWPIVPNSPTTPGTPNNTFPGTAGSSTAFSNVTMETFDQGSIRTSCMACHNVTMAKSDFLWVLNDHAFPPNVPNLLFRDPAFMQLKSLLETEHPTMKVRQATPQTNANRNRRHR